MKGLSASDALHMFRKSWSFTYLWHLEREKTSFYIFLWVYRTIWEKLGITQWTIRCAPSSICKFLSDLNGVGVQKEGCKTMESHVFCNLEGVCVEQIQLLFLGVNERSSVRITCMADLSGRRQILLVAAFARICCTVEILHCHFFS